MELILSALLLLCGDNVRCKTLTDLCIEKQKEYYLEPLSRKEQGQVFNKCFDDSKKAFKD